MKKQTPADILSSDISMFVTKQDMLQPLFPVSEIENGLTQQSKELLERHNLIDKIEVIDLDAIRNYLKWVDSEDSLSTRITDYVSSNPTHIIKYNNENVYFPIDEISDILTPENHQTLKEQQHVKTISVIKPSALREAMSSEKAGNTPSNQTDTATATHQGPSKDNIISFKPRS